ncbi:hypothetical protein [Pseudalkalibacillus caeni]|uniref:Uncharacterized protein n=1 Tax=Exobacillus caeni TaxID=2574798 RepID=A0A5R9F3H4_9BACL|nr:hypothetical protein [Pseudalkalibacillus caeni]TLS36886.1 hypothetical protein FCL54_13095 [Pseudalkalibacillus caeni]
MSIMNLLSNEETRVAQRYIIKATRLSLELLSEKSAGELNECEKNFVLKVNKLLAILDEVIASEKDKINDFKDFLVTCIVLGLDIKQNLKQKVKLTIVERDFLESLDQLIQKYEILKHDEAVSALLKGQA